METALIDIVKLVTGNIYPLIPGALGTDVGNSVLGLSKRAIVLLIRADNGNTRQLVNVFDSTGAKVYTIERQPAFGKHWHIYAHPGQSQIAAVTIGLLNRTVDRDAPGSTTLKMGEGILGKLHRHYYDSEGRLYSWSRRSLYLEQITNPGGGQEEQRKRVARATLLRPGRFDWELQIDADSVDIVNTLATAFITMRSQWLTISGYMISAPGSRQTSSGISPTDGYVDGAANVQRDLLVYRPPTPSSGPVNFFNPPEFLEYKFTEAPSARH